MDLERTIYEGLAQDVPRKWRTLSNTVVNFPVTQKENCVPAVRLLHSQKYVCFIEFVC
jgi:hypothetical protein